MARHPRPPATINIEPGIPEGHAETLAEEQELRELLAAERQSIEEVEALYGDGQPFDLQLSLHRIATHHATAMTSVLEVGRELLRIKAHVPHGEFEEVVETKLDMRPRTARRYMLAAQRAFLCPGAVRRMLEFAPAKTATVAASVMSPSKIAALLTESTEEDLKQLEEQGTLAGRTLDEYARMTLHETRETLRAKDQLLSEKTAKIDALSRELSRQTAYPEGVEQVRRAAVNLSSRVLDQLGKFGSVQRTILELCERPEFDDYLLSVVPMADTYLTSLWQIHCQVMQLIHHADRLEGLATHPQAGVSGYDLPDEVKAAIRARHQRFKDQIQAEMRIQEEMAGAKGA